MDSNYNRMTRKQYIEKRKRRRRAMMLRVLAALTVFLVIAGIIVGIVFLIKNHSFSGTFSREVDISDRIYGDIALFLSDTDDTEINSDWVKSRVEPYTVSEVIALAPEGSDKNSYLRYIDPQSYNKLSDKINSDLDKLLTEIVKDRLVEKGYKDDMTDEETAALVNQILGMSASEYLLSNGISLTPALSDLSLSLIGTQSDQKGSFKIHGNYIDIEVDGQSQSEPIIREKGTLVFTESGRVYNEKQK